MTLASTFLWSPFENAERPGTGEAERILQGTYAAFNARDIEAVLAFMHPDVGWVDGSIVGHRAARDYWTRQWAVIDRYVEPVGFSRCICR